MKKTFFALFLLFSLSVYAYEPSSLVEQKATSISAKINAYLNRLGEKRFAEMRKAFATQLPAIQSRLISANDAERMYLLEFIRRHLPGAKMIDTPHLIDDDDR